MIYDKPNKNEDGLYFVKALGDNKKRHYLQLNRVTELSLSGDSSEFSMNLVTEKNIQKITDLDELNIKSAVENSVSWFGKKLSEDVVRAAYTSSLMSNDFTCEKIPQTKVFNANQELVNFDNIKPSSTCTVITEFAGLWFAKKAFGPVWNLVQVKVFDDPVVKDLYPEEYAIVDEEDTDQ
jgi:hypothetical protein